jgi:3-methyladenine DNA glycosylase AlkD
VGDPWIGAATLSLQQLLDEAAEEKTRLHWEKYLKGTATFRRVPMAGIRSAVQETLAQAPDLTTKQLLRLAACWFTQRRSEDKLAAVLLIAEHACDGLDEEDVPALAEPLASGAISDWNVCDWYATKALHGFVAGDIARRGPLIAAWGDADTLWQRRAGVVAFVKLAAQADSWPPELVDLVFDACAGNLVSGDRFAHTGPGWLLRELSGPLPDRVALFRGAPDGYGSPKTRSLSPPVTPAPRARRGRPLR